MRETRRQLAWAVGAGLVGFVGLLIAGGCSDDVDSTFLYTETEKYSKIDPELIGYEELEPVPLDLEEVRGIATGPGDRIYVAGDRAIRVFKGLEPERAVPVDGEPRCLGVAPDGTMYVAVQRMTDPAPDDGVDKTTDVHHVAVYSPEGKLLEAWDDLGEKGLITSIDAGEDDVFVVDMGRRLVYRFTRDGKKVNVLGQKDADRGLEGLKFPSPYADVAIDPTSRGVVWIADTGRRRLRAFAFSGDAGHAWGRDGADVEGFCGCCNPVNFAILPDGRFVTAEKGKRVERVKVYSADGHFETVVAGPQTLSMPGRRVILDVAVRGTDEVLVLDTARKQIRRFRPTPADAGDDREGQEP